MMRTPPQSRRQLSRLLLLPAAAATVSAYSVERSQDRAVAPPQRGKPKSTLLSSSKSKIAQTERHPETGAEQEQHLDWHDHLLERYNEYFVGSRGAGASEEASGPFSYLQVEEAGREKQGKKKLALAVDSSSQNTEKQLAEEQRNSQGGKSRGKSGKEETTGDGAKKDGTSVDGTAIGVIIVIVIIVLLTALVIVLRFFVCADHFDESLKPVWSDGGEAGVGEQSKRPRKEPRGGLPKLLVSSMDAAGTAEVDDHHVRRGPRFAGGPLPAPPSFGGEPESPDASEPEPVDGSTAKVETVKPLKGFGLLGTKTSSEMKSSERNSAKQSADFGGSQGNKSAEKSSRGSKKSRESG